MSQKSHSDAALTTVKHWLNCKMPQKTNKAWKKQRTTKILKALLYSIILSLQLGLFCIHLTIKTHRVKNWNSFKAIIHSYCTKIHEHFRYILPWFVISLLIASTAALLQEKSSKKNVKLQ
jgi:nucleoside recognition membrane protein YjiH